MKSVFKHIVSLCALSVAITGFATASDRKKTTRTKQQLRTHYLKKAAQIKHNKKGKQPVKQATRNKTNIKRLLKKRVRPGVRVASRTPKSFYTKLPIVYHPSYNISFGGIEKIHPFDAAKYGKVYQYLIDKKLVPQEWVYEPEMVTDQELLTVHTKKYLESLNSSSTIAQITEMPLSIVPNFLLRWRLLTPMKYATGGTILAAQLALKHGWAVNLSGGYHHAKANSGEGFCVYADIPIAVKALWKKNPKLKVMVVDLDAHQGNGLESIFKNDKRITVFDIYNGMIYPRDKAAQKYITFNHPVRSGIRDREYLAIVQNELPKAIAKAKPDLIIYNAGTDPYERDPLGYMKVSAAGLIKRDQLVFEMARKNKTPIMMVLSGGYTKQSAGIISQSLESIIKKMIVR